MAKVTISKSNVTKTYTSAADNITITGSNNTMDRQARIKLLSAAAKAMLSTAMPEMILFAGPQNNILTITGVKCDDLIAITEFKDYVEECTIVGKNGGKMTFTISKGGWNFASITVGGEKFNSKSEFISALSGV